MARSRLSPALLAAAALSVSFASPALANQPVEPAPLIDRDVLFGNPDRAAPQISPDGTRIAFLAPCGGVLNVWVGPADNPDAARPVTSDRVRGIRIFSWAQNNDHILFMQDKGGDENFHVFAVDLTKANEMRDLTPYPGARASIQEVSREFPDEILVATNNRDPQVFDVHRVNIRTGESKLVEQNDQMFAGYVTDEQFRVRMASRFNPDGGMTHFLRTQGNEWEPLMTVAMEDANSTSPLGFSKDGNTLYLTDSRDTNTSRLMAIDLKTREATAIAAHDKADVSGAIVNPITQKIEAVSFNYTRNEWEYLDTSIGAEFEAIRSKVGDGEISLTSRSKDDTRWTIAVVKDDGPVRYYLYDRKTKTPTFLFTNSKRLEGLALSTMHPVVIPSRDGLELVSYLTLPSWLDKDNDGVPDKGSIPMVLLVHGGPWARDAWGYNAQHQWLANRGYAVLSVNFRGSTGFGKDFLNAGNLEWGKKMHTDLLDAVDWAVEQGVAQRGKVAIMGGSYGGYAALAGLTFTPDVFACGVSIVGPSNLNTLLNSIPPYWGPMREIFYKRMGDPNTDEGRTLLEERSPLNYVDRITRPLLIGQGANDPRVKQAESDQIVLAMQEKDIPVTYVLFPDEGHGFARPENRMSFYAVAEAFLAEHLGGRTQPITEKDFEGSTIKIPAGKEGVKGLADALTR